MSAYDPITGDEIMHLPPLDEEDRDPFEPEPDDDDEFDVTYDYDRDEWVSHRPDHAASGRRPNDE